MRVRTYVVVVALVCALGGLSLAGFVFNRQQALDQDALAYESALGFKLDIQRVADLAKQLFVTSDLLFGSLETYMLEASKLQTQSALRLCREVSERVPPDIVDATENLVLIHDALDSLAQEIAHLESEAQRPGFGGSSDQLTRVDELTEKIVGSLKTLQDLADTKVQTAREAVSSGRTQFGGAVWSTSILYVAVVAAVLLWASRSVSQPLLALTRSARAATQDHASFVADVHGPVEVRALADHIGQFVHSLQAEVRRTTALIDAIPDTLLVVSRGKGVEHVKPGIDTPKSLVNLKVNSREIGALLGEEQLARFLSEVGACISDGTLHQFELTLGDGEDRRSYEVRANSSGLDQAVIVVRDLTEKVHAETRIRHLAYHDGLTGLCL